MKIRKIAAYTFCMAMVFVGIVTGASGKVLRADTDENKVPEEGIEINETNFPDPLFRKYIKDDIDWDSDGKLNADEIKGTEEMVIDTTGMNSLKGVEFFTELTNLCVTSEAGRLTELDVSKNTKLLNLNCAGQLLTSLDVSNNTKLQYLYCDYTYIESIDLSHNTELLGFSCCETKISELDVSANTKLQDLSVSSTKLRKIDVSHNLALEGLYCDQCYLTKLDVSKNAKLLNLSCYKNRLQELDVSKNPKLTYIMCADNAIKSLDLSKNTALCDLNCSGNGMSQLKLGKMNDLTYVSIDFNNLTSMDFSCAPNINYLYCESNSFTELDVSCLSKLRGLQVHYMYGLKSLDLRKCPEILKFLKDPTLVIEEYDTYREYRTADEGLFLCADIQTELITSEGLQISEKNFPDPYFREAVSKSFDKNNDGMLTDAEINSANALDMMGTKASSLKGIEYLVKLNSVNVEGPEEGGNLKTIDVSKLPDLTYLNCGNQPITSLNVDSNTKLRILYCNDTKISSLNLANNELLKQLYIYHTKLSSIDLTSCNPLVSILTGDDIELRTRQDYLVFIDSSGEVHMAYDPSTKVEGIDGSPTQPKDPTIGDFVERLYTVALGRDSEEKGKQYWVNEIKAGRKTGGDCGLFFLTGEEFANRNLENEDFVEVLYMTFFDRESEASGKAYWVGELVKGASRESVVRGFIDSKEWCNLCADYGVRSGAPNAKAERASKNAIAFATRLYTCCLGRDAEAKGLAYWSLALTNLEQTGCSAAKEFFNSQEFINFKLKDDEYVRRLYTTFMDREPEASEVTYWTGEISKGTQTRASVLAFFGSSEEFTNICSKYGIERGSI